MRKLLKNGPSRQTINSGEAVHLGACVAVGTFRPSSSVVLKSQIMTTMTG